MPPGLLLVAAYVVGSIPFAYIAVRATGHGDVRRGGSGNVGATNTLRVAGWQVALPVLVLDLLKGAWAVWMMRLVTADPAWSAAAAVAAVTGHCFPVWLKLSGGKGIATGAGAFLLVAPQALLASALAWAAVLALSRYVALASVVAAALLPVAVWWRGFSPQVVVATVLVALVVIWRHRGNLLRLVAGEEPTLWGRKR